MSQPQPVKDASQLYEVERRAQHAARPGFRITELQLSATQKVPWHTHTNVSDTFYVLDGHMRLFLQQPKEEVNLKPGEVYVVKPSAQIDTKAPFFKNPHREGRHPFDYGVGFHFEGVSPDKSRAIDKAFQKRI